MKTNTKVYRDLRFFASRSVFIFLAALTFSACGGSDNGANNSGPYTCQKLAGNYLEHPFGSTTLTISSDCSVTDSYCGYNAKVQFLDSTSGNLILTVIGTNGAPGCLASIGHACRSEVQGLLFGIDCGDPHQYLFSRVL